MRYREVQDQLRVIGILMSKRGNRIRVNHFGGEENTAYYTHSLDDALSAGIKMARPDRLPRSWCSHRR